MTSRDMIQTRTWANSLPHAAAEGWGVGVLPTTSSPSPCLLPEGEGFIRRCRKGEGSTGLCPSRFDNPFATCWTRPGAIPFRYSDGQSTAQLVERFAAANWRGAIIGPHGSGKSTLLETLKPALIAAGHAVSSIVLRNGERRLPHRIVNHAWPGQADDCTGTKRTIVIVDGYEQLSWLERLKLIHGRRRRRLGLLVTSHAATCLPTLIHLAPNRKLIDQLVVDLCDQVSSHIAPEEVAASHASHGSDVREIFFDLYDRYERRRRSSRTSPPLFS